MYIKKIRVNNFRLFNDFEGFTLSDFNIPNGADRGSGLNIFVGENGCGKTSLLDALVLPILEYKAESINISDFYSKDDTIEIEITADKPFAYAGTMPKVSHIGKGFLFKSKMRARETSTYLSSVVVSDQQFVRADGQVKPEDDSPDIRIKVNNPWKGARFAENDILYLDRNRIFQIRTGTYNSTRFDRLMEDYNYKHIKKSSSVEDIDAVLLEKVLGSENPYLKKALEKFEEICGQKIGINLISNYAPFRNAFLGIKKDNYQQISISDIGSGYEMIFTILYSYYLSQQSGKQLILLIDEPELHLHPKLQENFVDLLLSFSKDSQIFITTHSPLLIKQIMMHSSPKVKILLKKGDTVKDADAQESKLSYISSNEINYIAFQLPTEEYHNELYEELKNIHGQAQLIKDFDIGYFQGTQSEQASYPWRAQVNQVTLHTYVRNQIHHRKECGTASLQDLRDSIVTMRQYL